MEKIWRNMFRFFVVSLMFLLIPAQAKAGIVTDRFPIQMYAESQLSTYNNIGDGKRAGYADGETDLISVTSISNGWLRVSHPGSGGKIVNRWCKADELFPDPGYSNRGVNVKGAQTVYRTSTSGTKFGSVSNNESVIVLAERNNRAQILYRLDNGTGYKVGWVASSGIPPSPSPTVAKGDLNGDGKIDDTDISLLRTYVRQKKYIASGDMDDDGRVDIADLSDLRQMVANERQQSLTKKEALRTVDAFQYSSLQNRIGRVDQGDIVTILEESANAYKVDYPTPNGSKQGWVTKDVFNPEANPIQVRYPLNDIYVCGNDWMTKYSKRPSRPYHAGIDVKSSSGDKTIYAAAAGTVAASGWNDANGNFVVIQHTISGKTVYSFYCHMSRGLVSKGSSVNCGTPIGIIGNTGSASAGEHLHFTFVDKLMPSGGYWGYVTSTGNAVYYNGYTFYSPAFVIDNQRLP